MKTQDIGIALIIVTICLSFFAALVLSAFGYNVAAEYAGAVTTVFVALAGTVGGWFASSRVGEQKQAANFANLRAENADLQAQNLRAFGVGQYVKAKKEQ